MISRPRLLCLILLGSTGIVLAGCQNSGKDESQTEAVAGQAKSHGVAMARGKVEVQGGLVDIAPPASGTVRKIYIVEGQSVKTGQRLFSMSSETEQTQVEVAKSELILARARQQLRAQRLPPLRLAAKRLDEAVKQGATEAQRADDAHQAINDAQSELSVAEAAVEVARSHLDQSQELLTRQEVHAPTDGVVVSLGIQEGGRIGADATALILLPRRPLMVRAELNEGYVSSVHVGMHAKVMVDEDGGSDFPAAHVVRISPLVSQARLQDDSQRGPAKVVECLLAFDQSPRRALVGQNVLVSFYK